MVLVDTSVWIEVLRARSSLKLEDVVDFDEVVTCLPVVQEVLQGIAADVAFRGVQDAMRALPIVESRLREAVYLDAVQLYRRARRAGIAVRSSVDCLIAACAIRNGLTVLHDDRDFPAIARISDLRQRPLRRGR